MIGRPRKSPLFPSRPLSRPRDRRSEDDRRNGDRRVIAWAPLPAERRKVERRVQAERRSGADRRDRKSTRLNSSHGYISYAVFCLKKKKNLADSSHRQVLALG